MTTALSKQAKAQLGEFEYEPVIDFGLSANEQALIETIEAVKNKLGQEHPLLIGGKKVFTDDWVVSNNPANPSQVIGKFAKATQKEADLGIAEAWAAFEGWRRTPATIRADFIFKAAELLRERRLEFTAWLILEIAKSWEDANREVSEAISYLEFYGRDMLRLSEHSPLLAVSGEDNQLHYTALGAGLIVSPWNNGLALVVNMVAAAIVCGNTVVLNPSSKAPGVAYQFARILNDIGLPPGVFNYVGGPGAMVSEYLVAHPKTRFIAFIGSKEIGLRVIELAAAVAPGQLWIKRVTAGLGAKGAIIVDEDANLDEAATGIVNSAFGFQGQRCWACTRLIAVEGIYDELLKKVVDRTNELVIGPPEVRQNTFGPVISRDAVQRLVKYIEIANSEGRIVTGGSLLDSAQKGYYVKPTVVADIKASARVAREEIFGPLLSVIKADSFAQAIELGNDTIFGQTNGVFSENREHLQIALEQLQCGTLLFNQIQPVTKVGTLGLSGQKLSGTGARQGLPDYLLHYLQTKLVSERL